MDAPTRKPTRTLELMRWVVWAERKAGEEKFRTKKGLSLEQLFVLGHLFHHPGAIQRDVAQMTRTSAASVSSLLQGLERRGFVERRTEGGDERSKRVYATPAAIELIAGLDVEMAEVEDSILAPLNKAERVALNGLLTKITAVLPQPTPS